MLSYFRRYHALELGHDLQGFRIQRPAVEITDVVFEQRGHTRAARLDVPIMAGVICVHPIQANVSDKGANSKLARVLVEEPTKLRPGIMSESKKERVDRPTLTMEEDLPRCQMAQIPASPAASAILALRSCSQRSAR
jgi:hypothetical protein